MGKGTELMNWLKKKPAAKRKGTSTPEEEGKRGE